MHRQVHCLQSLRTKGTGGEKGDKTQQDLIPGGVEGFVQDQQTILSGRHLCPREQSQCFVRVQGVVVNGTGIK